MRAINEAARKGKKKGRDACFPLHPETPQFRYFTGNLPADSVIYISEKAHGTSGRRIHALETLEPTWWQRLLRRPATQRWVYLDGSRRVTLDDTPGKQGYYGTNEFRHNVSRNITLHKGEAIYFEIVGYVSPGQLIMQAQELKDKNLVKQFKTNAMTYTYGCVDGEQKLFVYRITRLNVDGIETELSWPAVVGRCNELGLQTTPLLHDPIIYRGAQDTKAGAPLTQCTKSVRLHRCPDGALCDPLRGQDSNNESRESLLASSQRGVKMCVRAEVRERGQLLACIRSRQRRSARRQRAPRCQRPCLIAGGKPSAARTAPRAKDLSREFLDLTAFLALGAERARADLLRGLVSLLHLLQTAAEC